MSLCLSIPTGPTWEGYDLCVALLCGESWDWNWSESDLGYRLRVESVEIGVDQKHHAARLFVNPAGEYSGGQEVMPPLELGDVSELVGPGQQIVIYAEAPGTRTGGGAASRSFLFHGFMPCPALRFSEDALEPTFVCTSLLQRVDAQEHAVVRGRYVAFNRGEGIEVLHVDAMPAVFNWRGEPNRHKDLQTVTINGHEQPAVPVFTYDGDPDAVPWKLADVLTYLLVCHFDPAGTNLGIVDGNGFNRCADKVQDNDGHNPPVPLSDPNTVDWDAVIETQAPELVMEGMPIVDKALPLWCKAAGARMTQVTHSDGGEPDTKLAFWLRGEGGPYKSLGSEKQDRELKTSNDEATPKSRSMALPKRDTNLKDAARAEARRSEILFDADNVITSCRVVGDPVYYEIRCGYAGGADTFFPLWGPDTMFGDNLSGEAMDTKIEKIAETTQDQPTGDAATMFDRYSYHGAGHYDYLNIGRWWGLNESGEYDGATYGRTNGGGSTWAEAAYKIYDFHTLCSIPMIGGSIEWIPRRRAILDLLSKAEHGDSHRPILQCSWDSGVHWYRYPGSHVFASRNEPHKAQIAVRLTDFNLARVTNKQPQSGDDTKDQSVWEAIVRGAFRLALTFTVAGDECVEGSAGPAAGWGGYTREHIIKAPPGGLVKHVRTNSPTIGASGWAFDSRDDTDRAGSLAAQQVQVYSTRLISGTVHMPFATTDWLPGDLCTGIEPRGVNFPTSAIGGRYPEVVRVLVSNRNTQSTQVTFDDLRTLARGV